MGFLRRRYDLLLWRIEQRVVRAHAGADPARRAALGFTDRALLLLARLLAPAAGRPDPVPGWRFGADLDRDSLPAKVRKWIAWHFQSLAVEAPLELAWHHGLRVRVLLGADAARCLFAGGRIDPNEFAFLERALAPGQVFVDAGANDGLYSLFASRKLGDRGTVLAIEPSARELARLKGHLELNRAGNVRVVAAALGAAPGRARLRLADEGHAGQNTFGTFGYEATRQAGTEEVAVERLDDVLAREGIGRVDVLKLDVEGAEAAALAGAARTLAQSRPLLLVEVFDAALRAQGSSAEALLAQLDALGYDILTFDEATGRPRPARPGEALSLNIVALPRDRPRPALEQPRLEGEFIIDCLGGRTRRRFYDFDQVLERQPMKALDVFAPALNEEHYDWIDLFEAARRARGTFTVVELGAGHGRWLVNAANLARRTGLPLGTLVGCEAEPTHFAWMQQHFRDNGLDPAAHRLVRAAVAANAGTLPFYVGSAASWYGQSVAQNVVRHGRGAFANLPGWLRRLAGRERPQDLVQEVPAVTLASLLEGIEAVDLLHVDIQGAEYDVLEAAMDTLDRKVRLAHIGTHVAGSEAARGRDLDALVHGLFAARGWTLRARIAPEATHAIEGVAVRFVDGVQSWGNPRL